MPSVSMRLRKRLQQTARSASPPPPPPPRIAAAAELHEIQPTESNAPSASQVDHLISVNLRLRKRLEDFHRQNSENVERAKSHIETLKRELFVAAKALREGTSEEKLKLASMTRNMRHVRNERDALADEVQRLLNEQEKANKRLILDARVFIAAENIAETFCANRAHDLTAYRRELARNAFKKWTSYCARRHFANRSQIRANKMLKRAIFRILGVFPSHWYPWARTAPESALRRLFGLVFAL